MGEDRPVHAVTEVYALNTYGQLVINIKDLILFEIEIKKNLLQTITRDITQIQIYFSAN